MNEWKKLSSLWALSIWNEKEYLSAWIFAYVMFLLKCWSIKHFIYNSLDKIFHSPRQDEQQQSLTRPGQFTLVNNERTSGFVEVCLRLYVNIGTSNLICKILTFSLILITDQLIKLFMQLCADFQPYLEQATTRVAMSLLLAFWPWLLHHGDFWPVGRGEMVYMNSLHAG